MRALVIVMDSLGIGAAPDAEDYGDEGANTLGHLAAAVGGLTAPTLHCMGLGNIPALLPGGIPIAGIEAHPQPSACFGAMQEMSRGKDTTTGHWEIAGIHLERGLHLFPATVPCFPPGLVSELERRTGRKVTGNRHASGTAIIEELGARQIRDGSWIAYTSADSVFQVAAHESVIPLEELYRGCEVARELCDPLSVGRVIARPYLGKPGSFKRTRNRRDYSLPLPEETILDRLEGKGVEVTTVGKLDDIFNQQGITDSIHVGSTADAEEATLDLVRSGRSGLVFVNLIDFDMLYGHRRDPEGYARAIESTDRFVATLAGLLNSEDLLIITADHGNDPTFRGTDHTREFVPLLAQRQGVSGISLGIRQGFYDIAQSLATWFEIDPMPRGTPFL